MRGKFKKFVVYLLATAIIMPLWLVSGLLNAKPAMAAICDQYITTKAATSVNSTDATLNGTNGDTDATGHSFWVSLATFDTSNSTIPAGVYSTPDLGSITASTPFSASLASITTTGVPTNLPAVTPSTTYYFAAWSLIGGTWYSGGILTLTTGLAGTLSAEDFGVVNYDVGGGLGTLKGYTAGFGLTGTTFAGATSVVVQLYSAGDLLQTNTAILAKFNADITGTQFSSPFDVSGTFDYTTDGYWTNVREAEYGQSIPATKVVATVTLANGKVVTAENTNPTGDPITIYPLVLPAPLNLIPIAGDGEVSLTWDTVVGADHYNIYYQKFSDSVYVGPISTTLTSAIITGLQNGVKYRFIVRAADVNNVESANAWLEATPVESKVVLASTPVTIAPESAQAAPSTVEQPTTTEETPAEEGQIKGEESTTTEETSEKINWTPWIILFILIVLAGAATGGYFYWFAGDEETQEAVKPKTEATKKPVAGAKTKGSDKKPRRW